ncbi:MAG: hypothetical protein K2Y37_07260 [Pirellulales bacterium]|nr:hypothetical protein [Pirellulales bacterium]
MTTYSERRRASRVGLLLWPLCAAALLLLPDRATSAARWAWQRAIEPARSAVSRACDQSVDYARAWGATWGDAREVADLRLEVERLQAELAELETGHRVALAATSFGSQGNTPADPKAALLDKPAVAPADVANSVAGVIDPGSLGSTPASVRPATGSADALLRAAAVEARVLGPLAQAWLVERRQIDRGRREGVQDGALVLTPTRTLLDRGRDAALTIDHVVLAGGRVWGRLAQINEWTSEVRRVTDEGYRDLVELRASGGKRASVVAPRGILEGHGGTLCRVRLIAADEPVAVGDVVVSASAQGYCDGPLVYGEVERAECPAGANHWDVWVRPAFDPQKVPDRVAVLRVEFNPARVAIREN